MNSGHIRKVLNQGFIRLVDVLGGDGAAVRAARVSYGAETKGSEKDKKLIQFLLANGHESPFEHTIFTFHVKAPLFVVRQWQRHRISSFNEISRRYTELGSSEDFYVPTYFRKQVGKNYEYQDLDEKTCNELNTKVKNFYTWSFNFYRKLLDQGVAREQARMILPQSMFTEFYWTVNARSLMNFLKQRADKHAQWEIRQYALVLLEIFKEVMPWTAETFTQRTFLNK